MTPVTLTHTRARALLILAAVLWSTGSVFMRLLREPLGLGLDAPLLTPLQIAFYRGLFGGLIVLALVPRAEMKLRPRMAVMTVVFAVMSCLYLSALGLGPAANAIFLQNTAPLWVYVFAVAFMGERSSRRGWETVLLGAAGAVVIVAGNWPRALPPEDQRIQTVILLMGVGSGVSYAVVVLFLRSLREHSSAWLVALNLLGTAIVLGAFVLLNDGSATFWEWVTAPTVAQAAVLVVFGAVQMALPYWLFTRSLRAVSPHEAAIITLLEPLLNPVWAYLLTPEKDTPNVWMFSGGGLILLALVWQYLPRRANPRGANVAENDETVADKPAG